MGMDASLGATSPSVRGVTATCSRRYDAMRDPQCALVSGINRHGHEWCFGQLLGWLKYGWFG